MRQVLRVRPGEVAPEGSVTAWTLCNYLQDAAGDHAEALGVSMDRLAEENLAWVLTRLELDILRMPRWREKLVVDTWPSKAGRAMAHREFRVETEDGTCLVRASSDWVVMDIEARRAVRIPAWIREYTLDDRGRLLGERLARLEGFDGEDPAPMPFRARWDDLDRVGHVNNARFAGWIAEAARPHRPGQRLTGLSLGFRAEARHGDTLEVHTGPGENGALVHAVRRGETEVVRAESRWSGA